MMKITRYVAAAVLAGFHVVMLVVACQPGVLAARAVAGNVSAGMAVALTVIAALAVFLLVDSWRAAR